MLSLCALHVAMDSAVQVLHGKMPIEVNGQRAEVGKGSAAVGSLQAGIKKKYQEWFVVRSQKKQAG